MDNTEPTLTEVDDFMVAGLSVRTINSDEFNKETAKLPQLWDNFFSSDMAAKAPNSVPGSPIFGVYSDYASDATDYYSVTAGVRINPGEGSSDLRMVNIEKGHYLVFKDKGMMPQIIIKTWERIWIYFSGNSEYKRLFRTDFEAYLSLDEIAIYIGIKKK